MLFSVGDRVVVSNSLLYPSLNGAHGAIAVVRPTGSRHNYGIRFDSPLLSIPGVPYYGHDCGIAEVPWGYGWNLDECDLISELPLDLSVNINSLI